MTRFDRLVPEAWAPFNAQQMDPGVLIPDAWSSWQMWFVNLTCCLLTSANPPPRVITNRPLFCLFFSVLTGSPWTPWTRAPSHICPTCKCWTSAREAPTSPLKERTIQWLRRSRKHKTARLNWHWTDLCQGQKRAFKKWEWTCECHVPGPLLRRAEWQSYIFLVQDTRCSFLVFLVLGWLVLHIFISELIFGFDCLSIIWSVCLFFFVLYSEKCIHKKIHCDFLFPCKCLTIPKKILSRVKNVWRCSQCVCLFSKYLFEQFVF